MYIVQVRISNIRSLRSVSWEIEPDKAAGWHVILGDNGAGKTSFLRSIALALVGPSDAQALRQPWAQWLRGDEAEGWVRLDISFDASFDELSGSGRPLKRYFLPVGLEFIRDGAKVQLSKQALGFDATRYVWGQNSGWFSASYGPFRRFSGGEKSFEKLYYANPKLAAHLSVFDESVALTESLSWLRDLQFKKLESRSGRTLLDQIRDFVNQDGFLPHGARLTAVTSEGVEFIDGNGYTISVEELSDGYRSVLSMTFELIRQMAASYRGRQLFSDDGTRVDLPGVVLIDEADAHLHPSWQRRFGLWLRLHFPRIQFIVATHSPLICQAANVGSVWQLPKPGTDEDEGHWVTGAELDRLLYGNILDAYGTELFGEVSRSDAGLTMLNRLAELNLKELHETLSREELDEQQGLRSVLPTDASTASEL